jgi:PhnB protein
MEQAMPVTPYLFFDGRCEEAIEFYKKTLGAKVEMLMRFKESPDPGMCSPGAENKVMHACLSINGANIMASDGRCQGQPKFEGFALSVNPKDEAEAERVFAALSDGGQVQMPLAKTFFARSFGMASDRFGVNWMVIVEP